MSSTAQPTPRVLLIGLEGVDWSVLQTVASERRLPILAGLLQSGVTGQLAAPAPPLEQALWTSLLTGKRAHKHGVLHSHEPLEHGQGTRAVQRPTVKTATLGAILSQSGQTVHQIGWPVSHPVEHLHGVAVSDRFASEAQANGWPWVSPAEAARELLARRCAPADVEEVSLASLVPTDLITQPTLGSLQQIGRAVLAESTTLFRAAKWCMQRGQWSCTVCAFPAVGRLQKYLQSTLSQSELSRCGENILTGCYEHLDMLLGQLIATAGDATTVVVVGIDCSSAPHPRLVWRSSAIKQRTLPPSASVLDVTPTILALLGIPIAQDMDGQVWTELLPTDTETQKPVATWDTCVHPAHGNDDDASSGLIPKVDESVRYLLELGYVDPLETAARERADRCRRETQLHRALSLFDAGELGGAADELRQLQANYPDWPLPYELLAEVHLQQEQYDAAAQELEFLIHHGAESARLYLALGRIAVAKRNLSEALQHYHVAARIPANLRGLQMASGLALLRLRKYEQAETALNAAIGADGPSAQALDALATCSLGQQRYETAAEHALAAIEQDPQFAPAHYHLALSLIGLDRLDVAKQALASSAAVDPQFVAPLRRLARLCREQLGESDEADVYHGRAREIIRRRRQATR